MDFYDLLFARKMSGGGGGGGSSIDVEPLSVITNGTYTAPEGTAYSPVDVNVPVGWTTDGIANGTEPNGNVVVNAPSLKKYALAGCTNIQSLVVNSTELALDFIASTPLPSVILPNLVNTAGNSFRSSTVPIIVLPSVTKVGTNGINSCDVETVDLGSSCTSFDNSSFNGDTKLGKLILRSSSVVSMPNVNALSSTKFKSGGAGGEIYVPTSLINTYKTSTNWSTYNGYGTITWKAIEGSQYENYYADGTPIGA